MRRIAAGFLLSLLLAAVAPALPLPAALYQDLRWRLLGPLRAGWSLYERATEG